MTVKTSISLSDAHHSFALELIEAGRFPSFSAVMQQGVEMLRRQLEAEELDKRALAELLDRRRAGSFITPEQMDERIDQFVSRKRKAHGLQD